ncbi:sulfatase [Membranihabitans marinus]
MVNSALQAQEVKEDRPNIVIILADDLGWADININDPLQRHFYETPHIDQLAREGMRFANGYSNGANCSPTRAALLSGQYYPHQPIYHVGQPGKGKMISAENGVSLPSSKVTIAESLKILGYKTGFIGKWHIGDVPDTGPLQQGFDINIGGYHAGNPGGWPGGYFQPNNNPHIDDAFEGEYLTDYLSRKAVSFIKENKDNAFYLQFSMYTPHSPYQAKSEYEEKYQTKTGEAGHNHAGYAAMIESMDESVGNIMNALKELGLEENTLFIFCSDNGGRGGYDFLGHSDNDITSNAPLKSGKGSFYEGGIRVPMMIKWPRKIPAQSLSEEAVMTIDFYPTILAAVGSRAPSDYLLDGENLLPLLTGQISHLQRENIYWHFPGYPNSPWRTSPVSVIRSGDWKLMRFYEDDKLELYNLGNDVGEKVDLSLQYPEIRNNLFDKLQHWLKENKAPMPTRR